MVSGSVPIRIRHGKDQASIGKELKVNENSGEDSRAHPNVLTLFSLNVHG